MQVFKPEYAIFGYPRGFVNYIIRIRLRKVINILMLLFQVSRRICFDTGFSKLRSAKGNVTCIVVDFIALRIIVV